MDIEKLQLNKPIVAQKPQQHPVLTLLKRIVIGFGGIGAILIVLLFVLPNVYHRFSILSSVIVTYLLFAYFVLPLFWRLVSKELTVPKHIPYRARTMDGLLADPLNIGIVGSFEKLKELMASAGWEIAEPRTLIPSIKMLYAGTFKKSYPTAPVSSYFLFGRKQDICFQKEIGGNPRQRHHVRFWQYNATFSPKREDLWIGSAVLDSAVGLNLFNLQLTHRIDPDVDAERDLLIKDLQNVGAIKSIETIKATETAYDGRNGGGDQFFASGKIRIARLR